MTSGQQGQFMQRGRRSTREYGQSRSGPKPRGMRAIVAHRAFAPMMGLWGALLGALPVLVIPPAVIAEATRGTLIGVWNIPLQPVLASAAALLLGGAIFGLAAAVSARLRGRDEARSIVGAATRRVRPIDPSRDLGTRSLDDPIETMPFATPAWRDHAVADAGPGPEVQAEAKTEGAGTPAHGTDADRAPRALDLAEFASMPGRNAVWVEEPAPTPEPSPEADPVAANVPAPAPTQTPASLETHRVAPPPAPGTAALARLRAVPPSELSLAQMVERFAGALHEHRAAPPARALGAADVAAREAALAEALKALAALSGESAGKRQGEGRDEPLRAAIARLEDRRGAA